MGVLVGVCVGVIVGVRVGVEVGVSVGVFVGVSVGVLVGVSVGVFVGPGVPSDATTSPDESPFRFHTDITRFEPLAAESEAIDLGTPAPLASVADDHVVYGLLASRYITSATSINHATSFDVAE